MSRIWGGVLALTGFIACPCHLPLTLPLILGVLGGTAIGAFLSENQGLVYGVATGYFIVGIGVGVLLLQRRRTGRLPLRGKGFTPKAKSATQPDKGRLT